MKITNSAVAMASEHRESSYTYRESMTMEAAKSKGADSAILSISQQASGKSMKESMAEYQELQEKESKQNRLASAANSWKHLADEMRANQANNQFEIADDDNYEIQMLRRLLAALRGEKGEGLNLGECKMRDGVLDLRSAKFKMMDSFSFGIKSESSVSLGALTIGTTGSGTTWQKITATSGFTTETESTSFATSGFVQTADGRSIGFNVEMSMSRAAISKFDALEVCEYIKMDPLVINMNSEFAGVTDMKFFFDLDSDGETEEISFAKEGSGFLALDKNGDGIINDGSELFGTKSGDGFKDLAKYDEDGNGWIDENDSVFSKLKVWTKDKDGNDKLIDLKAADVGAIYLGNADTQFSLKDSMNSLNAEIKKTGIYLKESTGQVGSVNHVDLVV